MKMSGEKLFVAIVIVAVSAAVLLGFILAGAPSGVRAKNADQRRVDVIMQITSAVDTYWNRTKTMPQQLDDLKNLPEIYLETTADPFTGIPFDYQVTTSTAYMLCATFEAPGVEQEESRPVPVKPFSPGPYERLANHEAGYQCFEFFVNKWAPGVVY